MPIPRCAETVIPQEVETICARLLDHNLSDDMLDAIIDMTEGALLTGRGGSLTCLVTGRGGSLTGLATGRGGSLTGMGTGKS